MPRPAARDLRLGIVATHPVQYQAPWFRSLADVPGLQLEVLYCHHATPNEQAAAGFGVPFTWDTPLLKGYTSRFLRNVAREPRLGHFNGLDTPELFRRIGQRRYDAVLVLGWNYKSDWQAFAACWAARIPVMVRGDSHLHTKRHVVKRTLKWLPYRLFLRRMNACLAVGTWSKQYFTSFGTKPDRVFIVPHIVEPRWFARPAVAGLQVRAELGLDQHATVFMYSGKMLAWKRPMDFVWAVQRARGLGANVQGLMIGDGPLRSACEGYARQMQVPVRFAGFVNQSALPSVYHAGDALVLPSSSNETWGLVVNEAMACGRPCLVSDSVGSGPDMVLPGVTGEIFPVGDVSALAALMLKYAVPGSLTSMGAQVRCMAERYTPSAAVQALLAVLEAVVPDASKHR